MSEESVPKRQYTEEFKLEAVRLADSVGGHEAARRLGIPIATLSNWSRRRRKAPGKELSPTLPSSFAQGWLRQTCVVRALRNAGE